MDEVPVIKPSEEVFVFVYSQKPSSWPSEIESNHPHFYALLLDNSCSEQSDRENVISGEIELSQLHFYTLLLDNFKQPDRENVISVQIDSNPKIPKKTFSYQGFLQFYAKFPNYERYWFLDEHLRYTGPWRELAIAYLSREEDLLTTWLASIEDDVNWPWFHQEQKMGYSPWELYRSYYAVYRCSSRLLQALKVFVDNGEGSATTELILPTFAIKTFGRRCVRELEASLWKHPLYQIGGIVISNKEFVDKIQTDPLHRGQLIHAVSDVSLKQPDYGKIRNELVQDRLAGKWEDLVEKYREIDLSQIDDATMLYYILDEVFMGLYYQGFYDECRWVLTQYKRTYVTEHTLTNTHFLFSHLRERKRVIATFDPERESSIDEIVICYGDYPLSYDNLLINNPVYRHYKYFWDISHDEVESDLIWERVDKIYIINLDERVDRYLETLRELVQYRVPFSKVERFSACRNETCPAVNMRGWIGCTESHLEVSKKIVANEYRHTLVLEDDFLFGSSLKRNRNALREFFSRAYDYDICLLAAHHEGKVESYDDLLEKSWQNTTNTTAYFVSLEGAKKLTDIWERSLYKLNTTDYLERWRYVCDRAWTILQLDQKMFQFAPKLGFQRPGYSSITNVMTFTMD